MTKDISYNFSKVLPGSVILMSSIGCIYKAAQCKITVKYKYLGKNT